MSESCKVMGIVNVTPDSFSDGGMYASPSEAIRRALNMADEGAEIIDVGGESTRPGSTPLSWDEEWSRIEPVLSGLSKKNFSIPISVDTYHPETAERSLALGAKIVNCVYATPVPDMLRVCGRFGAELVVPFRLPGTSIAGRDDTDDGGASDTKGDVLSEIPKTDVPLYLDPMIGFGTTREEDLALLKSIPEMAKLGRVLIGASRKRIVKKLTGEKVKGKDVAGNLAIAVWSAVSGASAVRVHDVRETAQSLRVVEAISRFERLRQI